MPEWIKAVLLALLAYCAVFYVGMWIYHVIKNFIDGLIGRHQRRILARTLEKSLRKRKQIVIKNTGEVIDTRHIKIARR